MSGRFNEPRLMGNCENCYYATDRHHICPWNEEGAFFDCHRYPAHIEKRRGDYCGEFAWKHDASMLKEGA